MSQKGVGVSNLPNVRYRSFCKAGIDFNVMTVGSNGLGKSSFINQMLGVPVLSFDPFLDTNGGSVYGTTEEVNSKTHEDRYFHMNSLVNVQVSKFFVMENNFQTRVTVTEVDGVGDNVHNEGCWEPIVELINDNFRDFLDQERKNVRSLIKDKRVHVCLYFLEPSSSYVKMVDIRTMKEISEICNLVVVVGKSDLLSDTEREECWDRISEALSSESIDVFHMGMPGKERKERLESPFFIITKAINLEENSKLEREYPWGIMPLEQVENNDFYFLVDMLIAKNLMNLVEATETFYDDYRTREIGKSVTHKLGALGVDDRKLAREIQKKIKKDEKTIVEMRQKLLEKKKSYESKLFEITNGYDEK